MCVHCFSMSENFLQDVTFIKAAVKIWQNKHLVLGMRHAYSGSKARGIWMLVSCKVGSAWLAKLKSSGRKPAGAQKPFLKTFSIGCVSAERSGLDDALISIPCFTENFWSALAITPGSSKTSWSLSRPHLYLKGCKPVPRAFSLPTATGKLGRVEDGVSRLLWA